MTLLLLNPVVDHLRPDVTPGRMASTPPSVPAVLRCAHDDCGSGRAAGREGVRGVGCRPRPGPAGGAGARSPRGRPGAGRPSPVDPRRRPGRGGGPRRPRHHRADQHRGPRRLRPPHGGRAAEYGGVDVLANNAFRPDVFQSFEVVDLTVWRKIMDVNVFGSLQMTRAALPFMRGGRWSVVMVASMVARQPQPGQGGYAISKGALLTATGSWPTSSAVQCPRQRRGPRLDVGSLRRPLHRDDGGRSGVPAQVVVDELTCGSRWAASRATRSGRSHRVPRLGPVACHDRAGTRHDGCRSRLSLRRPHHFPAEAGATSLRRRARALTRGWVVHSCRAMSIATAPMPARRDQAGCAPCLPTRLVGGEPLVALSATGRHHTTHHRREAGNPNRTGRPDRAQAHVETEQ